MDGAIFIIVPHLSGSRRIREVLRQQASIKSKRGREGAGCGAVCTAGGCGAIAD